MLTNKQIEDYRKCNEIDCIDCSLTSQCETNIVTHDICDELISLRESYDELETYKTECENIPYGCSQINLNKERGKAQQWKCNEILEGYPCIICPNFSDNKEIESIHKLVMERKKNDNGVRHSIEDIEKMIYEEE